MKHLSSERIFILYECFLEILSSFDLKEDDVCDVFFCGERAKWQIPNTLFIIINANPNNRYYAEMCAAGGCFGASYLSRYIKGSPWTAPNQSYQFAYSVMDKKSFDYLKMTMSWNDILPYNWVYENNDYQSGLSIWTDIQRLSNLMAFA